MTRNSYTQDPNIVPVEYLDPYRDPEANEPVTSIAQLMAAILDEPIDHDGEFEAEEDA